MVHMANLIPAHFLEDDEVVAEYLTAALEDDNPDVFLAAVGNVAKARGMSAVAEHTGSSSKALAPVRQAALRHGSEGPAEPWREAHTYRQPDHPIAGQAQRRGREAGDLCGFGQVSAAKVVCWASANLTCQLSGNR